MKKYFFVFFILSGISLLGQLNLVQNYSFENVSGTLSCVFGPTPSFPNVVTHDQEALEAYWAQLPPWTVPEMKPCDVGVGSSDHFCTGGHTGQNFGSTANREYICQPLLSPIENGQRYYIEFYVESSGTLSNAGLKFSNA